MSTLRQRRRGGDDDDSSSSRPAGSPSISLESFDLYTKVKDAEDRVQTTSGGSVSLIAAIVCFVLLASALHSYLIPSTREHMAVDPVVEDRLRINFDITFPSLTCAEANLDAMDVAGEQQNGLDHDIQKIRLSRDGSSIGSAYAHVMDAKEEAEPTPLPGDYCGSCYGAGADLGVACCNSCDEVRKVYSDKGWDVSGVTKTAEQCLREHRNAQVESQPGEGCRLSGFMMVNKVAGNFHIAMGETHSRGAGHIHQFNPAQLASFNVSHIIHSLSFGETYPGIRNPLDATTRMVSDGSGVFMYYMKVIPTVYLGDGSTYVPPRPATPATLAKTPPPLSKGVIKTNQFSVTSQFRPAVAHGQRMNVLPGLFFVYDISPFMMTVTRHTTTTAQFLTSLFAILGGVLSLATLIDSGLFYVAKLVRSRTKDGIAGAFAGMSPAASMAAIAFGSPTASGANAAATATYANHYGQSSQPPAPATGSHHAHSSPQENSHTPMFTSNASNTYEAVAPPSGAYARGGGSGGGGSIEAQTHSVAGWETAPPGHSQPHVSTSHAPAVAASGLSVGGGIGLGPRGGAPKSGKDA